MSIIGCLQADCAMRQYPNPPFAALMFSGISYVIILFSLQPMKKWEAISFFLPFSLSVSMSLQSSPRAMLNVLKRQLIVGLSWVVLCDLSCALVHLSLGAFTCPVGSAFHPVTDVFALSCAPWCCIPQSRLDKRSLFLSSHLSLISAAAPQGLQPHASSNVSHETA